MVLGLVDADLLHCGCSRFPNLALMKIASKAKERGFDVKLVLDEQDALSCDELSVSKVFTETREPDWISKFKGYVKRGGTGYYYDAAPSLDEETERARPFYDIYAPFVARLAQGSRPKWLDNFDRAAIGFTTRGCVRGCPFCVNRDKRAVKLWSPVEEFDDASKRFIVLLDDNVFAYVDWARVFRSLEATNKPFCFKQGLDARLLTPEKARCLDRVKYKGEIYFAFDNVAEAELIEEKLKIFRRFCPSKNATSYVLCGYYESGIDAIDSALTRVEICARYRVKPYIMRYASTFQGEFAPIFSGLAAWCNQPAMFKKKGYFEVNEARSKKAVNAARALLPSSLIKRLGRVWE